MRSRRTFRQMRNPLQKVVVHSRDAGFSLVELVVTIVVSGILATGTVVYIGRAVEGLDSATARNQLATAGRIAVDRIALELHNALPNSIRVTTPVGGDQCIEFIPVEASTTYVNPPFRPPGTASFNVIDFRDASTASPVYPGSPPNLYAVIYPRRQNQMYNGDNGAYANWPDFPTRGPIEKIAAVSGILASGTLNLTTINLAPVLPATTHRFNRRSPNQRFFVVSDPVSFCVAGDKLYRYTNYGFFQNQVSVEESGSCVVTTPARCLPDYSAGTSGRIKSLITDQIDNSLLTAFTVGAQSLNRNALVAIALNFTNGTDSVMLNHEVLTRSVP